ncbi:defensin [Hordeum vulgare]|nr:defensin [Hordeum vulgare]
MEASGSGRGELAMEGGGGELAMEASGSGRGELAMEGGGGKLAMEGGGGELAMEASGSGRGELAMEGGGGELAMEAWEMGTTRVAEARHRHCESQSHKYRGACWRGDNCENVCRTEGFPSGKCRFHGIESKCFCIKPC